MAYLIYNGETINEKSICISPENRAFRYADGFFETIKIANGHIILQSLHLQRLYTTLEIFKFPVERFPSANILAAQIKALANLNNCYIAGRVRITIFSGNGLITDVDDRRAHYIIHASPLSNASTSINERGLVVDFFKDAVKPCDNYSSLKSNNCLPYVMASLWAKERNVDDAILLNPFGNISDATIANVFIVKDGFIKTPPLTDGAVGGVMRRYLIQSFKDEGLPFTETSLSEEDVLQASEVFLTNAIFGIRWIESIRTSRYSCSLTKQLHSTFISKLNSSFNF